MLWKVKGTSFTCVCGAIVGALVAIVISSAPLLPAPPAGLVRLRESLNPTRIPETLQTRTIFTRLSLEAFKDHPVTGVGLGRFDDYVVPYAHALGLGTGTWRDGATSVYLEILCELGIIGIITFIVVALSLRRLEQAELIYRGLGISFLVILVVMPHTNFPEGVALAGLLLACTVTPKTFNARTIISAAVVISMVIPFWYAPTAIYGFYPWERGGQHFIRWTAAESGGSFTCADTAELKLLNDSPQIQDVEVRTASGSQLKALNRGEALSVPIPCAQGRANYLLNVSPGFTPSKFGFAGDERLLGVRQITSEPIP